MRFWQQQKMMCDVQAGDIMIVTIPGHPLDRIYTHDELERLVPLYSGDIVTIVDIDERGYFAEFGQCVIMKDNTILKLFTAHFRNGLLVRL